MIRFEYSGLSYREIMKRSTEECIPVEPDTERLDLGQGYNPPPNLRAHHRAHIGKGREPSRSPM